MLPSTSISEPNSLPSLHLLLLLSLFSLSLVFSFISLSRFIIFRLNNRSDLCFLSHSFRFPQLSLSNRTDPPFREADVGTARSFRCRHRHCLLQPTRSDHALHETPTPLLFHETALRRRRRLPPLRP